jgi:hypothetical protein
MPAIAIHFCDWLALPVFIPSVDPMQISFQLGENFMGIAESSDTQN